MLPYHVMLMRQKQSPDRQTESREGGRARFKDPGEMLYNAIEGGKGGKEGYSPSSLRIREKDGAMQMDLIIICGAATMPPRDQ